MTINQLIAELKKARKKYGNVEIFSQISDEETRAITGVEYDPAAYRAFGEHVCNITVVTHPDVAFVETVTSKVYDDGSSEVIGVSEAVYE